MAEGETHERSLPTSFPHRLPTINGTQALNNEIKRSRGVPTGLPQLDCVIDVKNNANAGTGVRRGIVTEIYGPPGAGKTTFGTQLVVNAVNEAETDSKAVWVNTGTALVQQRLHDINSSFSSSHVEELPSSPAPCVAPSALDRLMYIRPPSLAHFLTLIMHPTPTFPPPTTSLLVIDDFSNYVNSNFPRPTRSSSTTASTSNHAIADKAAARSTSRRYSILSSLSSALVRLAASRNIAVVLLSNVSISIKSGEKALLRSALTSQLWDTAIDTKIILYRDLPPPELNDKLSLAERRGWRVAQIMRKGGRNVLRTGVPFVIEKGGLREIRIENHMAIEPPVPQQQTHQTLNHEEDQKEKRVSDGKHLEVEATAGPPQDENLTSHLQPRETTLLILSSPPAQSSRHNLPSQDIADHHEAQDESNEQPRPSKRKAIEIADSESEGDDATKNPYDVDVLTQTSQSDIHLPSFRLTGTEDLLGRESDDEEDGEDQMEEEDEEEETLV